MVVVGRFTKMAHFIGLHERATAQDVEGTFLQEVGKLHGLPSEIISDMEASFPANFGNPCAKCWELKGAWQRRTTLRMTDKRKGPTKCWKVPSKHCQLRSERLVPTIAVSRTRLQQLGYQRAQDDPLPCQLRVSSTDGVDERKRSS